MAGVGDGDAVGSPNTITLGLPPCQIPLFVGAIGPVLPYILRVAIGLAARRPAAANSATARVNRPIAFPDAIEGGAFLPASQDRACSLRYLLFLYDHRTL